MKVGMLWFDANRSRAVEERVERAASYYREKYGSRPTLCLVHPETGGGRLPAQVGQLEVKPLDSVLPNHFWVGVKPKPEANERDSS